MVGRGAEKDGYIAFDAACSVSPYNPVSHYNVDICANNEEQAVTPVKDFAEVLESPKHQAKLSRHYYHTKELIQGRKKQGRRQRQDKQSQRPRRDALGESYLQRGASI